MELLVDRAWKNSSYTIGRFFVDGQRLGESMEDTDRGLTQDMPLSTIKKKKVYGETAIPSGRYEIKMTHSKKFCKYPWALPTKGLVPEICNVKGFSGVRIHPLNEAKDSLGCIGIGKNDKKGWISNSTAYYRNLVDNYIIPAIERGEQVFLEIE